jgi:hypothetical protein
MKRQARKALAENPVRRYQLAYNPRLSVAGPSPLLLKLLGPVTPTRSTNPPVTAKRKGGQ